MWDAESGAEIACLNSHTDHVNSASFSPDGRRVVTGSFDNTARVWDAESGAEIACLNAHTYRVVSASFSPDGRRIVTAAGITAWVWDVAWTAAIAREHAIVLTATLAQGIGWRTAAEAADLLMQDAPEDLYAAARGQLLDPAKYSAEEIAAREHALEEIIAALNAPLHPNCYLSPTQFAEKFGLDLPGKAEFEERRVNEENDDGDDVEIDLNEGNDETGKTTLLPRMMYSPPCGPPHLYRSAPILEQAVDIPAV